jgi:fatty acid desaturase
VSASVGGAYGCDQLAAPRIASRTDLPPEVRALIRRLQRVEPWRNLRRLAAFFTLAAGGIPLALGGRGGLVTALGVFLIALAMVGLSVLMHEGCHHLLFRSRVASRLVGWLCGAPVLISVSAYRCLHLRHHAFERSARDPDDLERRAGRPATLVLLYYLMLVGGTYLYLPHVAVRGLAAAAWRERCLIVAEYAALLALVGTGWWLSPGGMLRVWLLPMVVAAQITNLRSLAEHGLTTGGSPFTATRSVVSNRLASFVFCNLNYHLEHHLFPAVPWYNLPALHRLLLPSYREAGASVYRSYAEFLADFLRATRSGLVPNVRLLPAHLRDELCV